MAGKNRGMSKRDHNDATEASSTAVELNSNEVETPTIRVFDPPDEPPSSDSGTPLPDDPSILKENVKGLKSQLRKHKQKVLQCDVPNLHTLAYHGY